MISEETWEKFKDGKVVFKCTTQELWDKLMVELEQRGHDIGFAKDKYRDCDDGYGIDNERKLLQWCNINYYREYYPNLEVIDMITNGVDLTEDDFRKPPVSTGFPQPPQELIDILHTIATCESIEKKYGIQLYLGELYDKREEYLTEWTSKFDTKL